MQSTASGFSENVYRAAALERIDEARTLLSNAPPSYVLATYVSGVAVECILLAYLMRSGAEYDTKHDVNLLAQRSGFFNGMSGRERQRLSTFLGEVFSRWQNNHRYRDEDALRSFIVRSRLFVVKGPATTRQDALRYNAEVLFEAASEIVSTGVARWDSLSTT